MTAKRAIWIVRAILYPSLALATALLLLHRGGDEAMAGPVTVYGKTSQGFDFNASFRDGRIYRLHTHASVFCPYLQKGYEWRIDDRRTRFVTNGDEIHARLDTPWVSNWSVLQHLRVDAREEGDRLSGTVSLDIDVSVPFLGTCRSGNVAFSAHE